MLKRKLSSIIVIALMTNLSATPLTAFAETINTREITQESQDVVESQENEEVTEAKISRFDTYYSNYREGYDTAFRMSNSNIESIEVNGNHRNNSVKENMIDGDLNTYWETAKVNSTNFTNEIVFNLNQETELNRIAYRSAGNTVGFAESFEIWGATEENPDEFKLVSTGSTTKTADVIEIKFAKTKFKKIKFVFKQSYNNTATVSEIMFYKEDTLIDKLNSIFTDSTLSIVSDEFNSPDKIKELEEEAKNHPLYEQYKETINNASALVNKEEVNFVETKVSSFGVSDKNLDKYNEDFKISRDEIISASNTGGTSNKTAIENVLDGDLNTFWESGKVNTDTYNNEVNFEFDEIKTINRIVYSAKRGTNRGFAQEFDIYASVTSTGDTFELISTGAATETQDALEFRFEPTQVKRIKFVYKKSV